MDDAIAGRIRLRARPALDVLVPLAPKDAENLDICISQLVKHCRNPIRAIHVVAPAAMARPMAAEVPVVWVDEDAVVPSRADVSRALAAAGSPHENATWYFQQLLKLLCFRVAAGAGAHVLVVDADYTFVEDVELVTAAGQSVLPMGYPLSWDLDTDEHVLPAEHSALASAARLLPGWQPVDAFSGMQHHMVFDRVIAEDLIHRVERRHGLPFWEAFLETADPRKWTGASEYVLYRHFAAAFFPERVVHRHLDAIDVIQSANASAFALADVLAAPRRRGVVALGCHRFLDYEARLATMDYIPDDLRRRLLEAPRPLMLDLDRGRLRIDAARAPLSLWGAAPDNQ